ncbi:phage/plasmid primase, P4 family [Microbacterium foliorum]|uniref:phage/plasmid primase, P4 family n=1 Tax=Microbacterium foliorum TaxID=104336 RepID=UPI00129470B3|nr:phage/plasmid primase, P4 family [Microbacterium foliorum]
MTEKEIRPSAESSEAEETLGGVAFDSTADQGHSVSYGSAQSSHTTIPSLETLIGRTVVDYLNSIADVPNLALSAIRDGVLARINAEIQLENIGRQSTSAPKLLPHTWLDELTVVNILLARYPIIKVDLTNGHGNEKHGVLAIYEDSGDLNGIYNTDESRLRKLISDLRPSFKSSAIESALKRMHIHAPVRRRTLEAHLIPVANGVFDHARQRLREFSQDWVFLSKVQSAYDEHAQSPRIAQADGTEWEVEEWFQSLSDDEGVSELLWQVASAALRPFVGWKKSAFLIGPAGNGGKGSFLKMLSNLVGASGHSAIPLAAFGNTFSLAALMTRNVNLVDENAVGVFATNLDPWKACITGDMIKLEEKYERAVYMRWLGFDIQCLNETNPRVKDKSRSMLRRMLFVPMVKNFSGVENTAIRDVYLKDPEVLAYVLKRALHMTHTAFDVPLVSQQASERWFSSNNKVVGWWMEHKDQFAWDLLPWAFLYDAYKAWHSTVEPSGMVEGLNQFTESLREHLRASEEWMPTATSTRPGGRMVEPEPLIEEYNLTRWMNPTYTGTDPRRRCVPVLKANYKGLLRRVVSTAPLDGRDD